MSTAQQEARHNKASRFMVAPLEILGDPTLRAQFMRKHGRIPVAPGHWSVVEHAPAPPAELLPVVDADPAKAEGCVNCGGTLPVGRTKFCSDTCSGEAKRISARKEYGHRHRFICVECGCELHSGRHRK